MHVLNPLTNTDIIGNVLYFQIENDTTKGSTSQTLGKPLMSAQIASKEENVHLHNTSEPVSPTVASNPKDSILPSHDPDQREDRAELPGGWTLAGPKVALAIGEAGEPAVPTRKTSVASYVSRKLSRGVVPNGFAPVSQTSQSDYTKNTSFASKKPKNLALQTLKTAATISPNSAPLPLMMRNGSLHLSQPASPRSPITAGHMTRFGIPISETDSTVKATPQYVSKMRSYVNSPSPTLEKFTESITKGTPIYFEALLLATDNDYLEQVGTRRVFAANALTPADVKLFEMPAYLGPDADTAAQAPNQEFQPELTGFAGWCLPSPAQLAEYTGWQRTFHRNKCWVISLLVAIAILVIIIVM